VIPVVADVATPAGQAALFAAMPEPDILVNNNAGPPFRDFRELDREKMIQGVIANMVVGGRAASEGDRSRCRRRSSDASSTSPQAR
jgi:hypothetical protein